jgi:ABC-2 type transport system ATP-binding protein
MIKINNFKKQYGNHIILDIPEIELPGGIHWIKGANGSGKSTFLKTLAGMLDFYGEIVLNNQLNLKQHPAAYRSKVNFSEAEPLFPSFLTGLDLLKLFLSAKKGSLKLIDPMLDELGVRVFIDKPLGTYSSGMIKKISLVLAFVGNPSLILLDEPLITIDTSSLQVLYKWIADKHLKDGISFIITSHQEIDKEKLHITSELQVSNNTLAFV